MKLFVDTRCVNQYLKLKVEKLQIKFRSVL